MLETEKAISRKPRLILALQRLYAHLFPPNGENEDLVHFSFLIKELTEGLQIFFYPPLGRGKLFLFVLEVTLLRSESLLRRVTLLRSESPRSGVPHGQRPNFEGG
jgi:hypothetical protein